MPKSQAKQRLSSAAAAIPLAAGTDALPSDLRPNVAELAGDSAAESTLSKLERATSELRQIQVAPFIQRAVDCIRKEDPIRATEWAKKALELDEKNGIAWRVMGIAREKAGDFATAISCFEAALPLLTDQGEIANDIGRLAYRLGQKDLAAKLFAHFCNAHPEAADGANNLACVLRDTNRYDEAIENLKIALANHPQSAMLWNTLGSVLSEKGEPETALVFFEEALRLDSHMAKARYNRGNTRLAMGDLDGAMVDCEGALGQTDDPSERAMMTVARSTINLCLGRIDEGWDDYEARLQPQFAGVTHFICERPRLGRETDLKGKSVLVFGEQGLGDEVLFANAIPDLIEDIGPDGKLALAVEPRMVPLFQRSFPDAIVGKHATYGIDGRTVRLAGFLEEGYRLDYWTAMGSLMARYRRSIGSYPQTPAFLKADPERVAHWRETLKAAPDGPKIGILWKSLKLTGSRHRHFSPFEAWAPVIKTPGITFVNLQYGDCAAELDQARKEFGVNLWTPPGIDLRNDLDDLAALTCALDGVLGFANATSNIAAACGANTWWISPPDSWVRLGADHMPWYPGSRLFSPPAGGEWDKVMADVAAALAESFT